MSPALVNEPDLFNNIAQEGERGCGESRTRGGVYVETGKSSFGKPLESFLVDFPVPFDVVKHQLNPRAPKLIENNGVTHLVDWIGAAHYPSPVDMIEEVRALGVSRRMPRNLPWEKITAQSTLLMLHPKAYVVNAAHFADYVRDWSCPCGKPHIPGTPCIGLHWHEGISIEPVDTHDDDGTPLYGMAGRRTVRLKTIDEGAPKPEFAHAVFARFPIAAVSLIAEEDGSFDRPTLERISKTGVSARVSDR